MINNTTLVYRSILLSITLIGVFVALFASEGIAQKNSGVTIDPIYQEITIPDKNNKPYLLKITNNTNNHQNFRLKTADFGSLDETGGVAFMGITKPDQSYKYGLTKWLSLKQEFISIAPGQTQEVGYEITQIDSLTPGGHYGAILVMPDTGSIQNGESRVQIAPVVSSLIFLKKVGGERYGLELKSSKDNHSIFRLPSRVNLRFQNIGNTHLVPRGTVSVKSNQGELLADGLINSESGFILPESYRQYTSELKRLKTAWWPGSYEVEINFRYDGNANLVTKKTKVYYIGEAAKWASASILTGLVILLASRKFKINVPLWKRKKA